jgi:L-cysteine S-thiosulfotransferase
MIRCVAVLVALTWSFAACAAEKRSGYEDARPETRAMQDDDGANPAFLWVKKGAALWQQRAGTAEKSCGDCHGDAAVIDARGVGTLPRL